ncbi:reverse transcriptase domain-containing protein [Tanacetum coccineum]
MYPPTTSESSVGDCSSESSAGPSCKKCRSSAATVTSSIHATRSLVPSRADLLPPRKRFRDSISPEDSVEEDIDTDVLKDIEANATAVEVVVDRDVETVVDACIGKEVDVGVDVEGEVEDEVESSDRGTIEVGVDVRIKDIETGQRELEAMSLITDGERASLLEQVVSLERSNARLRCTMIMKRARADRFRQCVSFMESELKQIHRLIVEPVDSSSISVNQVPHYGLNNMTITRSGMTSKIIEELVNRRVEEALAAYEATRAANALEAESQSQNGSDGDNGNGRNGNGGDRNGGDGNGGNRNGRNGNPNENNRGARSVARECTYQDFMKCQPLNFKGTEGVVGLISVLTWWNSHKRTIGADAAFAMSWRELMKLMAEVFQELTMLCTKMVLEEEDRVEMFIGGLPNNIQGNVIAVEPTRLQDVVRIANNLMDQKLKGYAMKNAENKRKFDNSQKDNREKQPPNKRHNVGGHNVARAYMAGNNEKRVYNGPLPLCNKCKFYHEGSCIVRCGKCKKVGHLTRDYKLAYSTTSNQRGQVVNQRVLTYFECGRQGHYMSDCPNLKDQNRRNKTRNKNGVGEASGKAYVLDVSYAVELVDARISETNTVFRGCTLGLLGQPFNIHLMPVELASFDVIIGMDWLANHHAVIMCDEKIVRIPYGDEILKVQGDRSGKGKKSKLSIISCTKTQKYIKKSCPIFLAQLTKKETEDKLKEKRLEDVPIVQDFPEVFSEDLPRLPPVRQVEFQIDLVPGAAPMAHVPYRLAPTELQELST